MRPAVNVYESIHRITKPGKKDYPPDKGYRDKKYSNSFEPVQIHFLIEL
jgi:hypothetical protein